MRVYRSILKHAIGREGLKMDTTKVEAIRKWPRPAKIIEVQQFIGFMQYVRKFIKNLSEMAASLTDLIIGAQMFKQENEFRSIN